MYKVVLAPSLSLLLCRPHTVEGGFFVYASVLYFRLLCVVLYGVCLVYKVIIESLL